MTQAARLVLLAVLAALPVASARADATAQTVNPAGEKLYKSACGVPRVRRGQCAQAGRPPGLGAHAARGADALLATVLTGRAPCARGGSSADEATLRAAVEYMLSSAR